MLLLPRLLQLTDALPKQYEYLRTVETLWDATREFARLHPQYIDPDNAIHFLVDDKNKGLQDGNWNLWSVRGPASFSRRTRSDSSLLQSLLVEL